MVRPDASVPGAGRQGAELLETGARLELPRALRRARRDPARPGHDLPSQSGLPLSLLPRSGDLRGGGAHGRRDSLNGMSKATDVSSGGSAHVQPLRQAQIGIQNVSSCVANHAQHAAGLGRAIRTYGKDSIVFCSVGESSVSEGYFYEAVNGASREKLPVIFVIQDNGYGISVPKSDQTANPIASDNFSGFSNLRIVHCDGLDVFDSFRAMREAVEFVRGGAGCAMVHATCVRIHSHSNSDRHEPTGHPEGLEAARAADPLPRFRRTLTENGLVRRGRSPRSRPVTQQIYEEAADPPRPLPIRTPPPFMISSSPSPGPEGLAGGTAGRVGRHRNHGAGHQLDVERRVPPQPRDLPLGAGTSPTATREASSTSRRECSRSSARSASSTAPSRRTSVPGHRRRVFALDEKIRVVVEGAEFADYFWPCGADGRDVARVLADQRQIRAERHRASPFSGGYIGGGLYHSQNIEGWLTTLPGMRIVCPAFADDAAGLLRTAIRSRGLTLYLEPKFLYNNPMARAKVPAQFAVPFSERRGCAARNRSTIVAYGTPVHFALEAAKKLGAEEKSVEVLDLCFLGPDGHRGHPAVCRQKTSRVVVAHEDKVHGGFGARSSADQESVFPYSRSDRARRIGVTPVRVHSDPGTRHPSLTLSSGRRQEDPRLLTPLSPLSPPLV